MIARGAGSEGPLVISSRIDRFLRLRLPLPLRLSLDLNRRRRTIFDLYRRHLYLVFDDWEYGYSIRKVSLSRRAGKRAEQPLSSDSEGADQGSGKGAEPLPVFMRISAPRGFPDFFTSAFGTKIMGMLPGASDDGGIMGVPTIDVQDQTFIFGPGPNYPVFPIYLPVGDDRLFTLDVGIFEVLRKLGHNGPWVWQELTYPPFFRLDAYSYGVQPDGSILVSTRSGATFIFDTKEYVWKRYGDWAFPFTGHGHYDPSLEGFVGLSKDPETLGYLYCCTMASTGTGDTGTRLHPSPGFKRSKEKVYSKNPAERHASATLLHMRRGKFCLVECVCIDNSMTDQELREPWVDPELMEPGDEGGGPQCDRFMYRSKTFSLSYDTEGDLTLQTLQLNLHMQIQAVKLCSVTLQTLQLNLHMQIQAVAVCLLSKILTAL
ncbi:uncharacterized protein C2845_PM12G21620 [Panicum miliaceum]|uniref:Uncharacterized protein n=1 Tax=Panicum miliaceum TaxID=4540 RepID=A0A3L6QGW1_PANMI|nr:uncharacterized protein C2845_PM12G21620 [Panicum miliaceum]